MKHLSIPLILCAFAFTAAPVSAVELTVSAASSLQDALIEISAAYQTKSKDKVIVNTGASGTLGQQILSGAPVDVFISAADKPMDLLDKGGKVLAGTRQVLLRNKLVLVVPTGKDLVTDYKDLGDAKVKKVALGEPETVPAGQYAVELLTKLKLWEAVKPKVVFGQNARQVLTYVETSNVDAGFVYATDALGSPKVHVVKVADEALHAPIVYPAAVVAATKHADAAKAFLAYLTGPEARAVFARLGFLLAKDPS